MMSSARRTEATPVPAGISAMQPAGIACRGAAAGRAPAPAAGQSRAASMRVPATVEPSSKRNGEPHLGRSRARASRRQALGLHLSRTARRAPATMALSLVPAGGRARRCRGGSGRRAAPRAPRREERRQHAVDDDAPARAARARRGCRRSSSMVSVVGISSGSVTSTTPHVCRVRNIAHARSASRRRRPGGTTSRMTLGTRSMSSPWPVAGASRITTSKRWSRRRSRSVVCHQALPSIAHSCIPGAARKKVLRVLVVEDSVL